MTDRAEMIRFVASSSLLALSGINWVYLNHATDALRFLASLILFFCACVTGWSVARRWYRKNIKGENSTNA